MTKIEYLSYSKPVRFWISFGDFFKNLGLAIASWFQHLPSKCLTLGKKIASPFNVLGDAIRRGGWMVRMNFLICGFTQLFRKQRIKGCLYLLYEAAFIFFMITVGGAALVSLPSLGVMGSVSYLDPTLSIQIPHYFDNSFSILLYSLVTIVLGIIMIVLWYFSIRDALAIHDDLAVGFSKTDKDFVHDFHGKNYHTVLLSIPMLGLVVFTIIPIIFMIVIGFTNYNSYHLTPSQLFDWVGWSNYSEILGGVSTGNPVFLQTVGKVLAWTLIWAFFATFSNYFLGMIVALLINQKGIKLKKMWRTILITTIAVPQFVSLLLISRMLNTDMGIINQLFIKWGWISKGIQWLSDPIIAKVMIIVVNTWIGIPYTMLICTGILMNIPEDLYESAKIDGASPWKMYMKITLPYMLFVTTPYLISQFVGNINNFNVIYLLSGGNPLFIFTGDVPAALAGVGQTDLLITWIYKMTMTNVFKDYGAASVLGVLVFIIVAVLSLIFYNNSNSVKNEEDFQ